MLRKTLAGLTLVAAALIANPFNHADAATVRNERRAAVRQCVNKAKADRNTAQNAFHQALVDARDLEPAARQAAVQQAQNAFRSAAQKANSDFSACIQAIDTSS